MTSAFNYWPRLSGRGFVFGLGSLTSFNIDVSHAQIQVTIRLKLRLIYIHIKQIDSWNNYE